MCNIAGYVGTREATPILLDMIRAQEGLNGGFYTGLAVHDGQGLQYAKLRGDLEKLCSVHDVSAFRGNAGIIHSRTPSGGGDLWAHPFTAPSLDDPQLCYVANGSYGLFRKNKESYNAIADRLVAEGYGIPCKAEEYNSKYNRLADGTCVHLSDVVCQEIYRYRQAGLATPEAMGRAYCELAQESVALVMEQSAPDRICFCRINAPMFVGFDETGAYLASSPTALPESVKSYRLLPALSCGTVYRDRVEVQRLEGFPGRVRGFDQRTVEKTKATICKVLEQGEAGYPKLRVAVDAFLPKNVPVQRAALIYRALDELQKGGQITSRQGQWAADGQTARLLLFRIGS